MIRPDLFFDSSALFAGVVSARGAARALLHLAEAAMVTITVSEQVIAETERSLARKVPQALIDLRETLRILYFLLSSAWDGGLLLSSTTS